MKLFFIFIVTDQFMNSTAISLRSFARNSRRRIPEWLENGHFNGHFNDHRHKKSLRESQSKEGILRQGETLLTTIFDWSVRGIPKSANKRISFFERSVELHFDSTQWQIQKTRNRLWQEWKWSLWNPYW